MRILALNKITVITSLSETNGKAISRTRDCLVATDAPRNDGTCFCRGAGIFTVPPAGKPGTASFKKSGRRDLNPGPLAPKASALAGLRYAPIYIMVCEYNA